MAIDAIDVALGQSSTPFMGRLASNLNTLRQVRESLLRDFAALDKMRDAGVITTYMATKVGAQGSIDPIRIAEATKLFDELSSLKSKIESEAPDTLGAAVLQICAKLSI